MSYYIYMLKDPRTSEVRYIGYTQNTQKRLRKHVFDVVNPEKCEWINELRRNGISAPILEVWMKVEDKHEAKEIENKLIHLYSECGSRLFNQHLLRPMTEEHKKRISKSVKKSWRRRRNGQ